MVRTKQPPTSPRQIDADLHRLEVGIRQLKVQYDMFFNGALAREPLEHRQQVEAIIKKYSNASIQKYAQRFHLSTLISRFNSLAELWGKTMRTREEGDRPAPALTSLGGPRERLVARCKVGEGASRAATDDPDLQRLYRKFVQAREMSGEKKRPPTFEKFARGIARQTDLLRKKAGCAEIELRVVEVDRKVQLKARPGK